MHNHYPVWKNILLGMLVVVGIIYALPNIFGDDPAVQIAGVELPIVDILTKEQIPYKAFEKQGDALLVRFYDTDTQLKARDVIKAHVGEDYIVALNLASKTPKWLKWFGANPMKLGLDLRGGVNFLLEVDIAKMIKAREDGDLRTVATELRGANIRYRGIQKLPRGIMVTLRDEASLTKAQTELANKLPDYTFTKVGNNLQLTMSDNAFFKVADYVIEQTMSILRNRVNELGISEALVQRQGPNHISVELPGIQDTARAEDIIGGTATLKFQMVDVAHDPSSGEIPMGTKLYDYEGHRVLLKDQVVLQGSAITYATAALAQDGRPAVIVHLGGGGESTFHRVTAENIGKPMAVVYVTTKTTEHLVGGKPVKVSQQEERIISIATIQSALGSNFEITGLHEEKYAQDLALLLRSGALVAPVNIVQELTVGPSMGKININQGMLSIVVGFSLVVVFMAVYYRLFGIIADFALLLNLIFIVAILSMLGATLTLPGMAGMVLTVGMAVDSNIVIYERIREELRHGLNPQASIIAGYARALTTIIDANVATLIVALVLFALGSGAVKGFAIVLTIGIMTSMLTAIVFTRAIVNLVYGGKNTRLSIGI